MTQLQLERRKALENERHNQATEALDREKHAWNKEFQRNQYDWSGQRESNLATAKYRRNQASTEGYKQAQLSAQTDESIARKHNINQSTEKLKHDTKLSKEAVQKAKRDESREYSNFASSVLHGGDIFGSWGSSADGRTSQQYFNDRTAGGTVNKIIGSVAEGLGGIIGGKGLQSILG